MENKRLLELVLRIMARTILFIQEEVLEHNSRSQKIRKKRRKRTKQAHMRVVKND